MALLKQYTTDSGLELELYYVITDINAQKGFLALDGYINQQAKIDGKAPVKRITYNYSTDPLIDSEEGGKVKNERYIDRSDGFPAFYAFVKKQPEFNNSKDA